MPEIPPAQRAAEKIAYLTNMPTDRITAIIDAEFAAQPAEWMRGAVAEIGERSEITDREILLILARHRDAEVERLTAKLDAIKAEIAGDANFGRIVELIFYGPLRESEAELRRLKAEPARPDPSELVEALRPFAKFAAARLEAFGRNSFQSYLEPKIHAQGGKIRATISRDDWDRAVAALANWEAANGK